MAFGALVPLFVLLLACNRGDSGNPAAAPAAATRDGGVTLPIQVTAEVASLTLGVPTVAAYGYRKGPGEAAFRLARTAEAAGAWADVIARCSEALAADPGHLDAAYLLAVARAKVGGTDGEAAAQIATPLTLAVAGDFAKWGGAALAQPALQAFLGSPLGAAWRTRVEEARTRFVAMLSTALVVNARGDLYAYDVEPSRWHRLTRTGGAVVGAFGTSASDSIVYVTRKTVAGKPTVGIGLVDLAHGTVRPQIALPAVAATATIRIAYNQRTQKSFVVRAGKWFSLADDGATLSLKALPAKPAPGAPTHLADRAWLDVTKHHARLTRLALAKVSADWDEHSLASAIRIGSSNKIVTVPSPGLIDGNTAVWSPDKTQLAFVAQIDDTCAADTPSMVAYVADAATGSTRELERAVTGIALSWVASRRLAVAGDHGVALYALPGAAAAPIAGADGLAIQRRQPRCADKVPSVDPAPSDEPADL
jgi:hypothetical protein